jgi:hypothetical protein
MIIRNNLICLEKLQKRIETLFSQLCDQFMIRRNYAKSFGGYKTRKLIAVPLKSKKVL